MSFLGRIIGFFTPLLYASMIMILIFAPTALCRVLLMIAVVYLLPLLSFRLHNLFYPLKKSRTYFDTPSYSPWWGSFQIQKIYYDLPFLESILRSTFLYSTWLRCWGAKVGANVHYTPNIEILDRSLLDIGDNVVFGHRVVLASHIVVPVNGRSCLFLGPVTIEKNSFLGAGAVVGPNCRVPEGSFVAPETRLTLNQVYPRA